MIKSNNLKDPTMLAVQAHSIVRYAKRNGITLTRGGVSFPNLCARGVLAYALRIEQGEDIDNTSVGMYRDDVRQHYGLTFEEIEGLEEGFETRYHSDETNYDPKYNEIGRNVAKLAGLSFD